MSPKWMKLCLLAAGVCNIAWGLYLGFVPHALFTGPGIALIAGAACIVASLDPWRHWPIVLAGLVGNLFGLIAFPQSTLAGRLSWTFGAVNIANGLIGLAIPSLVLRGAWRAYVNDPGANNAAVPDQHGQTLDEISHDQPVLLVFLRHFGCTFCREALADLRVQRSRIEGAGVRIALVHTSQEPKAASFFATYGLDDISRFSDPARGLYRRFELRRGRWSQLFGPAVWFRGARAALIEGHGIGFLEGDGFQMPGAFLVLNGKIVHAFRPDSPAARPDYCKLAEV